MTVVAALVAIVLSDVYLHNPRGSNNKLHEQNNNVQNNQRLFNSQNNNAGGYQVGDSCEPTCKNGNAYSTTASGSAEGRIGYYEGSKLRIEYTDQHGCGDNPNVVCQVIIQYMCSPSLRDGTTRTKIPDNADAQDDPSFGMHENYLGYQKCEKRERNKGLYAADRKINNNAGARATRQQQNGNTRRGYECEEERDYYPYWHPTPWNDIAVLTDNSTESCPYYLNEADTLLGECIPPDLPALGPSQLPNNPQACKAEGYTWVQHERSERQKLKICRNAPFTTDNHLGNTDESKTPYFEWTIPDYEEEYHKGAKCVLRVRYNISSIDPGMDFFTDYTKNGKESPVKNNQVHDFVGFGEILTENPTIDVTLIKRGAKVKMSTNTNQLGRTFQDRTHAFLIYERPESLKSETIHNLNVKGRRGNIVQTYPAVQYDFTPLDLSVKKGDFVHIQWTHSDANSNGNDGNGRQGTDRTNMVPLRDLGDNVPINTVQEPGTLFSEDPETILFFAYLSQENCAVNANDNDAQNCAVLNKASPTINGGVVQMNVVGNHPYMSSRNNDFSNRAHKGIIRVVETKNVPLTPEEQQIQQEDNQRHAKNMKYALIGAAVLSAVASGGLLLRGSGGRHLPKHLLIPLMFGLYAVGYSQHCEDSSDLWFPLAKGAGISLNFFISILLVPSLRHILPWVTQNGSSMINLHVYCAKVTAFLIVLHILFHIIHNQNVHEKSKSTSGYIATALFFFIMFCSSPGSSLSSFCCCKKLQSRYDSLYYSHRFYVVAIAVMLSHSKDFIKWIAVPLLLLLIDKIITVRKLTEAAVIEKAEILKDVLKLTIYKKGLRYRSGDFIMMQLKDKQKGKLSGIRRWIEILDMSHSFTISSSPSGIERDRCTVHIRYNKRMDWCQQLVDNISNQSDDKSFEPIEVAIDGPFPSTSSQYANFDEVILIGAGIGITPFSSIISSTAIKHSTAPEGSLEIQPVHLYWLVHDHQQFSWFSNILSPVRNQQSKNITVTTYLTGDFDVETYAKEGVDGWELQRTGRPDWGKVIRSRCDPSKLSDGTRVGVFFCGPDSLADVVEAICRKESSQSISISFHKESFDY